MIHISVISKEEQDLDRISALLSAQDDFRITCRGRNSYDALRSASDFHPDILIMDLWMNDINGTDLAPIIIRNSPSTKLIAISSSDDTGWIKRAFRVGISGVLLKQFDMDTLVNAVRSVLHDGYYLSNAIRNYAYQYFSVLDSWIMTPRTLGTAAFEWQDIGGGHPDITNIERKILTYIATGNSDKEIADKLCIALGTVRNRLMAIKRKTGQKTRAQVVVYSLRHGLIGIPPKT
jgi:two-component system response regulator DegU